MQTLVIRLPERLARRVRSFMESSEHGYASLNEFVEVALSNQLNMEINEEKEPTRTTSVQIDGYERDGGDQNRSSSAGPAEIIFNHLLSRPDWQHPILAEPADTGERLFALTNRLSPVKVASRVLANLAKDGIWPSLAAFHDHSASIARVLGVRLREEDLRDRRSGTQRRWVGYPAGPDERAALNRFVFSFTISASGGNMTGPLAVLGLASLVENSVRLTEAGWKLAQAPSPLLDEAPGGTVSDEEAAILRQQVRRARGESVAVQDFLSDVKRSAGNQARLDELMALRYPDWTQNLTIAHRAAMLGRLVDLRAISVTGRGSAAKIQLLPAAHELETE